MSLVTRIKPEKAVCFGMEWKDLERMTKLEVERAGFFWLGKRKTSRPDRGAKGTAHQ